MNGSVELLTVGRLLGRQFRIPAYQRGYRWRKTHVETLLKDLNSFWNETGSGSVQMYNLQPLVVHRGIPKKAIDKTLKKLHEVQDVFVAEDVLREVPWEWEVIDGQQRLTTLFIILACLGQSEIYDITYDTRDKSKEFLRGFLRGKVTQERPSPDESIDYSRMQEAYQAVNDWFSTSEQLVKKADKETLRRLILEQVQIIWYETEGELPVEVFTRLNIGNIKLTDSELIKALLLERSAFVDADGLHYRDDAQLALARGKLATVWDAIERRLQDDAFWLFLRSADDKEPVTRIDYLLELVSRMAPLKDVQVDDKNNAQDEHWLFHLYETYFNNSRNIRTLAERVKARETVWVKVVELYQILEAWYCDPKLYHYVGYLIAIEGSRIIDKLLDDWYAKKDKECFLQSLEERIRQSLGDVRAVAKKQQKDPLDVVYDAANDQNLKCLAKTHCKRILLLHNILTVISQGEFMSCNKDYRGQRVYYKFPFNLYKREKWDVEHVDSSTENNLKDEADQREWLTNVFSFVGDELKNRIGRFLITTKPTEEKREAEFGEIMRACLDELHYGSECLSGDEKNCIWNFVLLDRSTNRSYQNAIFPAKRRTIMRKERGMDTSCPELQVDGESFELKWPEEGEDKNTDKNKSSPFVAPCTKQVFLRYYSDIGDGALAWSRTDALSYCQDIRKVVGKFLYEEIVK